MKPKTTLARPTQLDRPFRPGSDDMDATNGKADDDNRRMVHELKVYQVELEAQNAELRRAHAERAAALRLYADLYTFAPVGYVTLTPQGVITEANRVAIKHLALNRKHLKKIAIQDLVAPEYADQVTALLNEPESKHFLGSLEVRLPALDDLGARIMRFVVARMRGQSLLAMLDTTEIRRLEIKVLEAARLERERLRADLHDGLGQELVGLSLALTALRDDRNTTNPSLAPRLEQLRAMTANAMTTCRSIVQGLSPVAKSGGGLIPALELLVKRPRQSAVPTITIAVKQQAPVQLNEVASDHVYRIAQEAINNAVMHSRGTTVRLVVEVSPRTIKLEVVDNGKAPESLPSQGSGLDIMRYRAREINGQFAIVQSSSGTRVTCTCPNRGE